VSLRKKVEGNFTLRVTVSFLAAVYFVSAILLGGLYLLAVRVGVESVRKQVNAEALSVAEIYETEGELKAIATLEHRRSIPASNKAFDALIEGTRAITTNLPSVPSKPARWHRIEADLYRDGDEYDHDALSREIRLTDGRRLLVGRDIETLSDRRELIVEAAQWATIIATLLGLAGGLALSRIISSRLARVNKIMQAVMAGKLSERVQPTGANDDFDRLSVNLNSMLDRIELLIGSISRVSDSIAHELRTPLTRLRATLEELADSRAFAGGAMAKRALEEAERLQQIFDALLRIARIETGRHKLSTSKVVLNVVLDDAVEYYLAEAEFREQQMNVDPSEQQFVVQGDRDLLFQAVANLIDNAVKFTPHGGQISTKVCLLNGRPAIVVRDSGPGVAQSSLQRLGERFYRTPEASPFVGTGFGLALVSVVARAHGGSVDFSSDEDGFEAVLMFAPIAPDQ
jgi:signal transduction histidine kinase